MTLPERMPVSAATALDLGPDVRARLGVTPELEVEAAGPRRAVADRRSAGEHELGLEHAGDQALVVVAHVGLDDDGGAAGVERT